VNAVFAISREVVKVMEKQASGSIINISSMAAKYGLPRVIAYSASKSAIEGMTAAMATELSPKGIRINAIAPGFIETDMTHYLKEGDAAKSFLDKIPLGRFGSGEEIANVTLFLASDMSSYITGQVISTCGGLNM